MKENILQKVMERRNGNGNGNGNGVKLLEQMSNEELIQAHKKLRAVYANEIKEVEIKKQRGFMGDRSVPELFAGNIGDINSTLWPFFFVSNLLELAPNEKGRSVISVTAEAPFVLTHLFATNFLVEEAGDYRYIDPDSNIFPVAYGLKFAASNPQSRQIYDNTPREIGHLGHAQRPYHVESPLYIESNCQLDFELFNVHPSNTYISIVAAYGYRVRVDTVGKGLLDFAREDKELSSFSPNF